ncbi:MAG: BamA/TamA family outer membrane protein, partial [Candidatus Aminicenantes bacterium]|nr:BamA/TamA family outer membrane protein [Candidatus Aminicenantes bacterium]
MFKIISALLMILVLISNTLFAQVEPESLYGKIIKEIMIEGLKRTKEYIVTRELISKVGEPLLKENLEREHQRLELLDIFSEITITPSAQDDGVVLTYSFVETFPFLPSISIQITDENGISAGGGLKSPNLLGRDIFFSGRLLLGGATTVELLLENPWVTGNHLGYKMEYYHRERENQIANFNEKADEFYLSIGSYLGEHGRIGGRFEFLSIRSDTDGATLSPDNHDEVSRFALHLGYDNRDAFSDTHRGWWNDLAFSREMKIFNSDTDFYQVDLDIRRYIPLADGHTLALFSLTTLRTGTVGEDVAPWQLFGIGGTNTVRGWEYAARTGKNQFINTLEYRFTILKSRLIMLPFNIPYKGGIHLAVFGDLGIG